MNRETKQREIRFRAWDENTEQMLFDGFMINQIDNGSFVAEGHPDYDYDGSRLGPTPRYYMMQFAGLYDANKQMIFEGDVVTDTKAREYKGKIIYTGCAFLIEWYADVYSSLLGWRNYDRGQLASGQELEVIGNIWANPELLEKVEK